MNWKIKKNDQIFNLGSMHLNKLRDIKRIKGEKFKFSAVGEDDDTSDEDVGTPNVEER